MRQTEDVGRRSRREPCRSSASPSSATRWHHWSRPGWDLRRLHIISSWWMLREIEAPNATLRCVSFSGAAAHVVLPTRLYWPGHNQVFGVRTCQFACVTLSGPRAPSAAQVGHSRPGRMAHHSPVHRYSRPRLVMWTPKCKSAVQCVLQASLFGTPLETLTGARRCSRHTFRATGTMYLASCGIDVRRIQLHGRWSPRAVLRYVRLSLLAQFLSLEASSGIAEADTGSQSRISSVACSMLAS